MVRIPNQISLVLDEKEKELREKIKENNHGISDRKIYIIGLESLKKRSA